MNWLSSSLLVVKSNGWFRCFASVVCLLVCFCFVWFFARKPQPRARNETQTRERERQTRAQPAKTRVHAQTSCSFFFSVCPFCLVVVCWVRPALSLVIHIGLALVCLAARWLQPKMRKTRRARCPETMRVARVRAETIPKSRVWFNESATMQRAMRCRVQFLRASASARLSISARARVPSVRTRERHERGALVHLSA